MRARTLVSIAAALVLIALVAPPNRILQAFAAPQQPKTLPGHVPDAVARGNAQNLGHHNPNDLTTIAVGLPLRNEAALQQFLQTVNDPSNPGYHQFMTQDEANQQFNPTVRQEQEVVQWLQANGLTVTQTYPNHLIVDAQGTFGQIERMLRISINDYRAKVRGTDRTFYAPAQDPTVDASVADVVQSITGLDNFPRFHTNTNGTAHGAAPYYPQDFANAYDVNPLWTAGYNGSGQHIGITLWTVPPSDTTLSHFGSVTGAAVATTANGKLKVIKVDGGTTTADDGEAGMDIEYSGGMAPSATIDYYEAPTDSLGNPTDQGLEDALNQAGTDANNNQQITNSWGGCEASSTSDPFTSATNNIFSSNSATGHNYFFSSGDNGSWCDPSGTLPGTNPYPDYPTSSPYVTSVGGTKFNANVGSSWPGESAWAYSATGNGGNPEGSGGGYSNIFSRPSWQTGSGLAANGKRGYPDISADADPNTGAEVCYGSSSACAQIGGTSLASPLWAGFTAVLNQYLAAQGKPSAGFLSPTIYRLATTTQTYAEYHDITSGTNGAYNAGANWDAVTGWGSTDLYNLARDLAGTSTSPTPTPTTGPTATPTATSVPTTKQLIVNGGFESGQSPWTESSSGGYQLVDPTRPHTGSYSAYLCGYNNCTDQISQAVTLPSTFTKATLAYWYYSDTSEAAGSPCYDYFYSRITNSSGTILTTTQSSCNSSVTNGWVYKSFDVTTAVSSYKGQTVKALFRGTNDVSLPSDFFVDDVTLTTS
jgi:subtilase family serine protease